MQRSHLTHTLVFAALLGGVIAWVTASSGPWAALGFLTLAIDAVGTPMLLATAVAAGCWFTSTTSSGTGPLDALAASRATIGLAAGIGRFTHCLGDSITRAGCPWLFPLPILGETWYEIRPRSFLRFRAGGPFEHVVMVAALVITVALLLPDVWEHLTALFDHVRT